jgi:predicted transcriptional regulator of viral defense system
MEFRRLVEALRDDPLFETSLLFSGKDSPRQAQRQVADWARSGRVVPLRRGLYALSHPYARTSLHPFVVANRLASPSYVSLHMALSYYSLIPEHVVAVTSVTTGRPGRFNNPFGAFTFQHVQTDFFFGFAYRAVTQTQWAFVATPEKALLDLVYLWPGGDDPAYLRSLRLQNLDLVNPGRLSALARRSGKPKLARAARSIAALAAEEATSYLAL